MTEGELARMRPTDGARYVLEHDTSDAASARYRAWILTSSSTFAYTAALAPAGDPALAPVGEPAPSALLDRLTMFARLLARGAPPWPHRIVRWRADRSGGQSSSSE